MILHKEKKWHTTICGVDISQDRKDCRATKNKDIWPEDTYELCNECWETYESVTEIE